MNQNSSLPLKAAYFCVVSALLAGSILAISIGFIDKAAHPGIIAAIILVISGIGSGIFSLYKSTGMKGIIIPATAGLILNLSIASATYIVRSWQSPDTPTEKAVLNIRSIYTPLTDEKCKLIDTSDEGGYSLQSCPGVFGYQLQIEDFDARMTVTIVDPDNNEHPLEYDQFVTGHFSELGEKAEWRIGKVDGKEMPVALIVRVYSQDLDNVYKQIPYLAVSKITPGEFCVTDRIPPGPKQNGQAQQAADRAINSKCLDVVND